MIRFLLCILVIAKASAMGNYAFEMMQAQHRRHIAMMSQRQAPPPPQNPVLPVSVQRVDIGISNSGGQVTVAGALTVGSAVAGSTVLQMVSTQGETPLWWLPPMCHQLYKSRLVQL